MVDAVKGHASWTRTTAVTATSYNAHECSASSRDETVGTIDQLKDFDIKRNEKAAGYCCYFQVGIMKGRDISSDIVRSLR